VVKGGRLTGTGELRSIAGGDSGDTVSRHAGSKLESLDSGVDYWFCNKKI